MFNQNVKKILLSGAALLMTASLGANLSTVSAKHRTHRYHYRTTRVRHRRRTRRYHTGYYRYGIWHTYATGYYNRNWKWVSNRKSHRKHTYDYSVKATQAAPKRANNSGYHWENSLCGREIKVPNSKPKYIYIDGNKVSTYGVNSVEAIKYNWAHRNTFQNAYSFYNPKDHAYYLKLINCGSGYACGDVTYPDGAVKFTSGKPSQDHWVISPAQARTKRNLNEMKSQTLTDINNDRAAYHENPLQEDPGLDQVASIRAKQSQTNFNHYDPNNGGRMYEAEVADETGHSLDNTAYAENLGQTSIGNWYNEDTNDAGQTKSYDCHNGNDMANANDDSMMNYDHDSGWAHRNNILGNYNWIGVGTSKDSQGNYYLAEDFAQ